MSVAVERVLAALRSHGSDPRPSGSAWSFRCPLRDNHHHDDRRPSGWLTVNGDGKVCATCKACGPDVDAQLLSAIGLSFADLYLDAGRHGSVLSPGATKLIRAKSTGSTRTIASGKADSDRPPAARRIIAEYDYINAAGELLFQVVRFNPKGFSQRRPDGNGGWVWNMKGVGRVLYRLPEIVAAPADAVVYIVEGEKAADVLAGVGLVATCSPGGAGKWSKLADDSALDGRHVVILPDNDDVGCRHAEEVASLSCKAAVVKVLELSGLPDGGDVADLIDDRRADGKDDAAIRRELLDLADAAPAWAPPAAPLQPAPPATEATTEQAAPFSDGEQSRDWLKATGGIWRDQVEAGIVEVSDRILGWFERRGPETLTKPDGDLPRESVSYAASIVGVGSRQRMYQLRDWARTRRLASTTVDTADCQPAVDTLTERTLRPLAKLLAAGRPEDVPEVVSRAYERFRERQEDARTRAATSRYPVRIPKAPSSYDVRAAVDEVLPPTPGKSHAARPAVQTTPDAGELAELSGAVEARRRITEARSAAADCSDVPGLVVVVLGLAEAIAGMDPAEVPDDLRRAVHAADRLARQGTLGRRRNAVTGGGS